MKAVCMYGPYLYTAGQRKGEILDNWPRENIENELNCGNSVAYGKNVIPVAPETIST
jgi:hypothetical protein